MAEYRMDEKGWALRRGNLQAPLTVLVDLDSTLADTRHRSHLTPHNLPGTTWDTYSMRCADDAPIAGPISTVRALAPTHRIRIVSGRSVRAMKLTIDWLGKHNVPWDLMRLRRSEDSEDPIEYKRSVLAEIPPTELVVLGIDDWPPVIEMWAEHGIPGLCVNPMYSEDPNAYFTKAR